MPELTFVQELVKAAVGGTVPTLALILGGRWALDKYDIRKRQREQELERVAKERLLDIEIGRKRRNRLSWRRPLHASYFMPRRGTPLSRPTSPGRCVQPESATGLAASARENRGLVSVSGVERSF